MIFLTKFVFRISLLSVPILLAPDVLRADEEIDFARDIRPILSNHCFKCHGNDETSREADLRLDTPEGAYADLGGYQAVNSEQPEASALLERITETDPDLKMPPADSGLTLNDKQIALLKSWIQQGGRYEQHWAFRPIVRPPVPQVDRSKLLTSSAVRGPLDAFVVRRLADVGLAPSPEADRQTLIRRVYLDLLGLAPNPQDITEFLADSNPGAYERMVDRVLASPRFGEKWGRHWLDQARYADTNGYSIDSPRTMWPYRDWVIDALNNDLPFDQFTIEQLAGDLLPSATREQLVATGFHRNTLINQEGGTDREQFRNEAVVDRVSTTGAVWLGLTVGCAQCHTHKFDPLTQREFYQLFGFFNSSQDVNSVSPTVSLAGDEQNERLRQLDRQIAEAKKTLADYERALKNAPSAAAEEEEEDKVDKPVAEDPDKKRLAAALKMVQDQRNAFAKSIPAAMVMGELSQPRTTHVLIRGDFLRHGDVVKPDTPEFLPGMQETNDDTATRTRLDLARWLVDGRSPLTARVTVNRLWMRLFGQGLVETENDFGLQGTPPTHPQLFDWLATEFMQGGWSTKHLLRTIVVSATYRQASEARPDAEKVDPLNKLLARQSRVRVDAEIVRDLALSASGLLDGKIGGESVYPPQPAGVYAFTQRAAAWPTSKGADRYRRGMYTFFMRSAPHPMLTTFDSPAFNTTCTRRPRSNTPLQSLTMANDEALVEAAQALARRILTSADSDPARLAAAFGLCLARSPSERETNSLLKFLNSQRQDFAQSLDDAQAIGGRFDGDANEPNAVAERAAWTVVARVLLNLDEFITRE